MVGVHEFLHYANEAMKEFLARQTKEPFLRCVVAPLRETFFWCALPSGLDVPCEAFLPHATAQRRNVKSKNPSANPHLMITIDFPKPIETHLTQAASKFGKSMDACIEEAVLEYLDDLDYLSVAQQRMQSFNPDEVISHEEIMRRYG